MGGCDELFVLGNQDKIKSVICLQVWLVSLDCRVMFFLLQTHISVS